MRNIAIAGQPNSGKSTIFNNLTNLNQVVSNYPGVTIEKKEGIFSYNEEKFNIIDLPGAYGLSPVSSDEDVARRYLLKEKVDLIINVVDGTTLERGLFFTLQILLLEIPTIVFINMEDLMKQKNIEVDLVNLTHLLGAECIIGTGRDGRGIDELKEKIYESVKSAPVSFNIKFPQSDEVSANLDYLSKIFEQNDNLKKFKKFYALKFIEGDSEIFNLINKEMSAEKFSALIAKYKISVNDKKSSIKVIDWIYSMSRGIAGEVQKKGHLNHVSQTEALDKIVLNKYASIPILFVFFFSLFLTTFKLGHIVSSFINWVFESISIFTVSMMGDSFLSELLSKGVIMGVGSVISLIPYIFIMFFFIKFLEDSGYMGRAAFITDRFMHKIGLHGKSFIPVVMGFGCSVPAVLAVRTLETKGERLKTILLIPFVPCSSRLTVIILIGGALFGASSPFIVFILYVLSISTAALTGFIYNKLNSKDAVEGLIMELPDYRMPSMVHISKNAAIDLLDFIKKAGTIIFGLSILIFLLTYFPRNNPGGAIDYLGHIVNPVFRPLGFTIEMTISLITGFFAKESIVSTLSILYNTNNLSEYIFNNWNLSTGFAFLVFLNIYIPCLATAVVIKQESRSFKYLFAIIIYSILLAYFLSLIVKFFFEIFI